MSILYRKLLEVIYCFTINTRYLIDVCPETVNRIDIRGYTALHKAVKLGNVDIIKMLLLNGGAQTGIQGHRLKTPLHYANDPTTVRLLMEKLSDNMDPYKKMHAYNANIELDCCSGNNEFVDSLDKLEMCNCKPCNVCGELLELCDCKPCEKCKTSNKSFRKSKMCKECKRQGKVRSEAEKYKKHSVFGNLLRHNDAAAMALLDEHLKLTGSHVESKDALVVYDFRLFQQEARNPDRASNPDDNECDDFAAHLKMIEKKSSTFEHPLSTALVELESQCTQNYLPWLLLRTILFVLSLSALVLWQDRMWTEHFLSTETNLSIESCLSACTNKYRPNTNKSCLSACINNYPETINNVSMTISKRFYVKEILKAQDIYIGIGFYCLYGFVCFCTLLIIHREVSDAWIGGIRRYCSDFGNLIEIFMILSTTTYLVGLTYFEIPLVEHIAAWSIFFAWIEVLLMLSRVPRIGMFTFMFFNVTKKLLWYLLLYTPGLIAFALAYHVLPHVTPSDSPFRRIDSGIFKVLLMMTGEINYENYFEVNQTIDSNAAVSTQILLLIFVVLFCIVLANLLVGLAVSEIEKEKKEAMKLYNTIAVKEIDGFWRNVHKSMYFKCAKALSNCFERQRKREEEFTYLQTLTGTKGVLKMLQKQWRKLNPSSEMSWKLCVDPNRPTYPDHLGLWGEIIRFFRENVLQYGDTYEVYFYNNSHNDNSKIFSRKFHKTGFTLTEKTITRTIDWLKHYQRHASKTSNHATGIVERDNDSLQTWLEDFSGNAYRQSKKELMEELKEFKKEVSDFEFIDVLSTGEEKNVN